MEKLKACMAKSLQGDEPTNEEVAAAIGEVADVIQSIASSLERIAVATQERLTRDPGMMFDSGERRPA